MAKVSAGIENAFTYHAPKEGQPARYEKLRGMGKELAAEIMELCPTSSEKAIAIDRLREAVMWANASIACNE